MSRDRLAAMRAQRSAERHGGPGDGGQEYGNVERGGYDDGGRYGSNDRSNINNDNASHGYGYDGGYQQQQQYSQGRNLYQPSATEIPPPPGPPSYHSHAGPGDNHDYPSSGRGPSRSRSNSHGRSNAPYESNNGYSRQHEEDEEARGARARDQRRRRPSQAAASYQEQQQQTAAQDFSIPPPPIPAIPQHHYMNEDPYGARQDRDYWDKNQSAVSLNSDGGSYSEAKLQKKKSLRNPQQNANRHEEYEIPELRKKDRAMPATQPVVATPPQPAMYPSQSMQGYPSPAMTVDNPNVTSNAPKINMTEFFESIGEVRSGLADFQQCIAYLDQLHSKNLAGNLNGDEVQAELEQVAEDTRKLSNSLRKAIKDLQETTRIRTHGQAEQERQTRKVQIAAVREKFLEIVQSYQSMEMKYRDKAKQRIERQYAIVNPRATQEEIRSVVDGSGGQEVQVFAQALRQNQRVADARGVLNEVQNRHEDIKKIEKTLVELFQLFQDMATMVEEQDEQIVHIETKAEEVARDMEVGHQEIQKAVVSAKGARKKRKICCIIMLILLLIIGGVIAYVVVKIVLPKVRESQANNNNDNQAQNNAVATPVTAASAVVANDDNEINADRTAAPANEATAGTAAAATSAVSEPAQTSAATRHRRRKYRDLLD